MDEEIHRREPPPGLGYLSTQVPRENEDCAVVIYMEESQRSFAQYDEHCISQLHHFWQAKP